MCRVAHGGAGPDRWGGGTDLLLQYQAVVAGDHQPVLFLAVLNLYHPCAGEEFFRAKDARFGGGGRRGRGSARLSQRILISGNLWGHCY